MSGERGSLLVRVFRDRRTPVLSALAVLSIVVFALTRDGVVELGPEPAFALSPQGDEVGRLEPVRVTFEKPTHEKDGAAILSLDPPVEGSYAWLGDRTLLFQPDYPGYFRGFTYTALVRAQPEAGLDDDVQVSFQTAGKLEVVSTIPADGDSDVPKEAQVFVQFSRSVAPLTLLAARGDAPLLEFTPPIEGAGEWLNTSLYRFVPDALAPNTEYTVRIAAGLTSAADGVLQQDYVWKFTSFGPALVRVTPDQQTQYAGPRQQVTLEFNQPMVTAEVESAFSLSNEGTKVPGAFTWNEAGTTATFTPAGDLAPLATQRVLLPAGLAGANGGTTLVTWDSTFKTVGPLRLTRTDPPDGSSNADRYGIALWFTQPIDPDSLDGKVSISGITSDVVRLDFGRDINAFFNVQMEASTFYTVNIAAGIQDLYGQSMPATSFSFTTAALPSFVGLAVPSSWSTYSASVEPLLFAHASNVEAANFTLWPLTKQEIQLFNKGGWPKEDWSPSQPAIRRWSEPVAGSPNEVHVISTSITGGGPLPKGDYLIQVGGGGIPRQGVFAFSVVDTNVVLKAGFDELLAWVVDHDTGEPVSGAQLEAAGNVVGTGLAVTDEDGLATFPLPPITDGPLYSERDFVVTLDDGRRYGTGSTQWQRGAESWSLGFPIAYNPLRYTGHIYTDRPVYRPGESAGIKTVLRLDRDAAYQVPADISDVDVAVRDPQGKEILRQAVSLSPQGTFPVTLALADDATTGDYFVDLVWRAQTRFSKEDVHITGTSFLVAEFRRPEFDVSVASAAKEYAAGDMIPVQAEASFFFGGAVAGATVEWSALSHDAVPFNEKFRGYSFSNYDYWRAMRTIFEPIRAQGTGTTSADGTFAFEVPATLLSADGPQDYTLSTTVTDQNGQAMAGSTTVTVYPADIYAGIRPTDWIAASGQDSGFSLVTLTKEGLIAPNTPVRVEVYERRWVTTKIQTPDGSRQYRSEPSDELVTVVQATTGSDGEGKASVRPRSAGTLRVVAVVTDASGREARSATYLWVSGSGQASWEVTNDDLISLIADKEEYAPGDTAEILVPAPFEGAIGLVTVERASIHSREVRSFPTASERLSIPIVDRSIPNVFVSVVLYRPPTAEDPVPRYKVGYANLKVTTASRRLDVSITPGVDQAQPGETVDYTVEVKDWQGKGMQSELSVSVVDQAVLALEEERSIDGLRAFWFERGLGIRTSSSMAVSVNRSNDAIPSPPGQGKGGGGAENERLREDFRNSAYWEAQIQTDPSGIAHVSVKLPDNLTTWRFQARAISGDILVGEAINELVSTRPLLVRPALPRFLRVGDSLELRALVRNATSAPTDVTVSIEADGVQLQDSAAKTIQVAAGTSEVVAWPATAVAEGPAKVVFRGAAANGTVDAVATELLVHLDVTLEAVATNGAVTTEGKMEAIYLPEFALVDGGVLDVAVQPTLVGAITGELAPFWPADWAKYFSTVDYASRAIAVSGLLRATPEGGAPPAGLATRDQLRGDIATLASWQRADGGWPWCLHSSCTSNPLVTAWVLLALGEAQQTGIAVDQSIILRADSYLAIHMNRLTDISYPIQPAEQAMYLYALARAGRAVEHKPEIRAVYEQYKDQLPPTGIAYLLLALHESGATPDDAYVGGLLNRLVTTVEPSANGNHWEDPVRSGMARTPSHVTALVLAALARVQPEHPLLEETVRWLSVARSTERWTNLQERAQALSALSEFAASTGELGADYSYAVKLNGSAILEGKFGSSDLAASKSISIPLQQLGAGTVTLAEFGRTLAKAGRLYYKLDLKYLTKAREIEALNRGFAVSHEYSLLDQPGARVAGAATGDVVRVKVTVITTQERHYVRVRDYLPAGLEPIDTALDATDPALKAKLNEDRGQTASAGGFVPKYWAPWHRWYYNPWQQTDFRDSQVELRTDTLPPGVHEYVYYARATTPGAFFVAPAHAEEGLFPEVFGRSDSATFTVR